MSKSLVLVVGAGASKEVNLPVGAELRSKIAQSLDINFADGNRRSSGDGEIEAAFRKLAQNLNSYRVDINPFLHSSWRIRDAMSQAISIDHFIDSHREDERIAICGKLAIARCILVAESESLLYVNSRDRDRKMNFSQVESTWFNSFFQLLTENCQVTDIEERLSRVTIITFNYDRCIEHYLYGALQNYYGVAPERAAQALSHLQIFHPYGAVAPLPWQKRHEGIEFGANVGGQALISASEGIRTFSEGIDPKVSEIVEIRETLKNADRVAFLGFAFHRLNLELLFPGLTDGEQTIKRPIFATGLGISNSDCQKIALELSRLGAVFHESFEFRNDLKCAELFREYSRSLGLN